MAFLMKYYTFSSQIRNLTDFQNRLLQNQQPPSGLEIVNTLRYFQQMLLDFLKDLQDLPTENFRQQCVDLNRAILYPNLNYSGLFYGVVNLLDVYHLISSDQTAVGQAILNCLRSMYFFLDRESVDQLPYILACLLYSFPHELHSGIMQLICDCILPYTLRGEPDESYATCSIPAVLMLVFQYAKEPSHHTWVLETLMSLRRNVYRDVLAVIAKGTSEARMPAVNLLFHYWPLLNPHILDRKHVQYRPHGKASDFRSTANKNHKNNSKQLKIFHLLTVLPDLFSLFLLLFAIYFAFLVEISSIDSIESLNSFLDSQSEYQPIAWTPSRCEHKNCQASNGNQCSTSFELGKSSINQTQSFDSALGIKKCYDPGICADVAEKAPPVIFCKNCAEDIKDHYDNVKLHWICQPLPTLNIHLCRNRGCQARSRLAISTCFDEDCIRAHQHVPIRLCQECHTCFHPASKLNHLYHTRMSCPWTDPISCHDTIEAVVKMLKETSCQLEAGADEERKRPKWLRKLDAGQSLGKEIDNWVDEKRMLSRYGVWLMTGICVPDAQAPGEAVGYIMSMVFQWFATTALLPSDAMGTALEQLKTDFVCDWLNIAIANHYSVFVQCLQPRPPEFAKIGGMWDRLSTRTEQVREGLSKFLAIMPYDVISFATWNHIMPEWLEVICNEVPEKDVSELRVLICKIFEPDLCPLSFESDKIFDFFGDKLAHGTRTEQQKALDWLNLLSEMDIVIPISLLLTYISVWTRRLSETEHSEEKLPVSKPIEPRQSFARMDSIGGQDGLFDEVEDALELSALTPEGSPIRKSLSSQELNVNEGVDSSNSAFFAIVIDVIGKQVLRMLK